MKMSKIKIKNFGPIKEGYCENDGWMDTGKVTVFIGNQGSGKSTIAKVFSTISWLEKTLNKGDLHDLKIATGVFHANFEYHRLRNYFSDSTEFYYEGEALSLELISKEKKIKLEPKNTGHYLVPKIMYVPAERNFLTTVQSAFDVKGLTSSLATFAEELRRAQQELKGKKLKLPINNYDYEFDPDSDASYVSSKDHKINLLEASSGFQSVIPLFLVSQNLSAEIEKYANDPNALINNLSPRQILRIRQEMENIINLPIPHEERVYKLQVMNAKFKNRCFINIVEEPEQNLYPTSQWEILKNLLEFNNTNEGNQLLMTTHSPYLINYLTLAVKAGMVKEKVKTNSDLEKINKIVPLKSTIKPEDLLIYELDEKTGTIVKLGTYKGLPSDENYLNADLEHSNEQFAQLQEIEKGW